MESWQKVWRDGLAPLLATAGLVELRLALESDDPRLQQGATTAPPPLPSVHDWPVESACAVGFCGWQGEGLETVGEVEAYFARACAEAERRLGEPASSRYFTNWYDETPRTEMRPALLAEVRRTLERRSRRGLPRRRQRRALAA